MNDIRSVIETTGSRNIHDFLIVKKMKYKKFSISVEKELEYPFSKSIEATNGMIQIQWLENKGKKYSPKIMIDAVLDSSQVLNFIDDMKDAEKLANFIENEVDFFFKEE